MKALDPRERAARIFDAFARSMRADVAGEGERAIEALTVAVESFEQDETFAGENAIMVGELVAVLERGVAGGSRLARRLLDRVLAMQSRTSTLQ